MISNIYSLNAASNLKFIPVVNSLRGLASVLVCLFHLVCLPLQFLENSFVFQLAAYGRFGVQIFFVITGVVIPFTLINSKYNIQYFGKFMYKRIARVEPPYVFSILIALLLLVFRNYIFPNNQYDIPTAKSLLLHLAYLIPFAKGERWFIIVFWTMAVEFQFYLIISILFSMLFSENILKRLISYVLVFGSAFLITDKTFAPVWLPIFMLGIMYVSLTFNKIKPAEFFLVFTIAIISALLLHNMVITIVAVATITTIHFFFNYKSKIGRFFGQISYSLYLMHTIFGTAIVNLLVPHVANLYAKLALVLLGFAVSVFISYLFYLWIEKPFQKYASNISLRKKELELDNYKNEKYQYN